MNFISLKELRKSFRKIYLFRIIKDFVRPIDKKDIDTRSLSFFKFALADKKNSILFASTPRSGTNWTSNVMHYYFIKKYKGSFEIRYKELGGNLQQRKQYPFRIFGPADSRSRNLQKLRELFPTIDVDWLLHTHRYWIESPLLGIQKTKKVIILTRDVCSILYSFYQRKRNLYNTFNEFFDDTESLDNCIDFINNWGRYIEDNHHKCYLFRYEDVRRDPVEQFARMFSLVENDIDYVILNEAVDYFEFNKEKQREYKFNADEQKHFHYKGALSYRDNIDNYAFNVICKRLAGLKYNFGYDYTI